MYKCFVHGHASMINRSDGSNGIRRSEICIDNQKAMNNDEQLSHTAYLKYTTEEILWCVIDMLNFGGKP
jgi:hypothetical protein